MTTVVTTSSTLGCCCPKGCCPDSPPPSVLNAAISAPDCPALDGLNVTLTYNMINDQWEGTAALGCANCNTVTITLKCVDGSAFAVFFGVSKVPNVGPPCLFAGPAAGACDPPYQTLISCDPFEVDALFVYAIIDIIANCCQAFCMYILIEITP